MELFILGSSWIFQLVLATLVFLDANKNNDRNKYIWAIVTFFFSFWGLLFYFLIISPSRKIKRVQNTSIKENRDMNNKSNRMNKVGKKPFKSGPVERY